MGSVQNFHIGTWQALIFQALRFPHPNFCEPSTYSLIVCVRVYAYALYVHMLYVNTYVCCM